VRPSRPDYVVFTPTRLLLALLGLGGLIVGSCSASSHPAGTVVRIDADGCPDIDSFGVGAVISGGQILTVAHVVAGGQKFTALLGSEKRTATLVAIDPINDLALLHLDGSPPAGFPVGAAKAGDRGQVEAVRATGPVTLTATVTRLINLRIEDIYLNGQYERPALELDATIEPGDSGSPVVVKGTVVGVAALRNRAEPNRAYAIDPSVFLAEHQTSAASVDSGACASVG
jgi:S1-C subfamily serine protease